MDTCTAVASNFFALGIITIGLSLVAFFTLTDRPETARWLNAEEKQLAVDRILSERVGATEVVDKLNGPKTLRGILNPVVLATSMILLLINITVQGIAFFCPTIIRTIYPDATVVRQQLLTVPPYIFGSFVVLGIGYASWRFDRRNVFMQIGTALVIPAYIMFLATTNSTARYIATFLVTAGAFAFGALTQSQSSANVVSDTARSAAIGTTVMFGNVGGLISTVSETFRKKGGKRVTNMLIGGRICLLMGPTITLAMASISLPTSLSC